MLPALIGAGLTGLGMALKNTQRKQNVSDQKELMKTQQENQMALNRQGQEIAQENWDYTNAENQVKHYEKAGLNVGLMYGGGGQGGTLGSASGGSASGGQAQRSDIDTSAMGMQIQQMALLKAQKENIEADTIKKKVEAEKTAGVDTEVASANKALTEMNTKNAEVQNQRESRSLEDGLDTIRANRDLAVANSAKASTEADISATTKQAQIDEINARAINEAFKLAVAKSGIKLNEAQIQNMLEQIKIGKFNAEKITTDQVAGKQLNSLIEKIYDIFGVKNETMK